MNHRWIKALLAICGVYDAVIGAGFLLVPAMLYRAAGVTLPNHMAYLRFPAMLLLIFAVMFFRASADPVGRREVIVYGMALKASYFSLVFWYEWRAGVPALWIPFAYADVVFFLLFLLAWNAVRKEVSA
jgi:hypothetical protein